jgi:transposase
LSEHPPKEGSLSASKIQDIRLAAKKMQGAKRRSFQAEMTEKYCGGLAWKAAAIFKWDQKTVELGLHEKRTGIICLGAQKLNSGRKKWEDKHREAAAILCAIAEEHSQQDPSFQSSIAYTRLTAKEAIRLLRERGVCEDELPSKSAMAVILNRLGYRLRKVVKAKPQRKIPETDAIFENVEKKNDEAKKGSSVKRLSVDCKATVKIGDYSRGGETRGDNKACDHDMGCKEKYTPFGILDEDKNQLYLIFGSSYKTSDFIVDSLEIYWAQLTRDEQDQIHILQLRVDNGPESSGVRTQFLKRIVELADSIGKQIQLLYYPPYHSKYNPIERCWGILEQHWNGTKLTDVETMLNWARSMTWKGINPILTLSHKIYEKGISLSKKAMRAIEARLKRNPLLPKWDIRIQPESCA